MTIPATVPDKAPSPTTTPIAFLEFPVEIGQFEITATNRRMSKLGRYVGAPREIEQMTSYLSNTKSPGISSRPTVGVVEGVTAATWAGEPLPFGLVIESTPDVFVSNHARSLITDQVEPLVDGLCQLILEHAKDRYVRVSRIEITAFVDPDEDDRQVVLTQWIRARWEFANQYWDDFGAAMTKWLSNLSPYQQELANDRIAVVVESEEA